MAIIQIVHNAVTAKVVAPDREIKLYLSNLLSYKVPGAEHSGKKGWDGSSSFFEMRPCTFPAGFVRMVRNSLTRDGHKVIVRSAEASAPRGPVSPIVDTFPEDPRYDYQPEVMTRLLPLRRMIAQVATGGGKSRIFKLCAERLGLPTLFITTRKSLAYQMAKTYKNDIGKPYGFLGDGEWKPYVNGVNFAIVDTLVSRLEVTDVKRELTKLVESEILKREKLIVVALKAAKLPTDTSTVANAPKALAAAIESVRQRIVDEYVIDKEKLKSLAASRANKKTAKRDETVEFLGKIGFLCFEEAHEVSGNGFYDLASHCKNAHYRLALTATPFMKDGEEANMRLMAVTGPVGIKISEKLLIDRGILAKPYFKFITPAVPKKLRKSSAWQTAYSEGIVDNFSRNMIAVDHCRQAADYGLTSMVLVQHTRHGNMLKKMLESVGLRVEFISGEHNQDQRDAALHQLANGEIDTLIGTTILDVGVDVPALGLVVLAGGGKPEVGTRQRIGRGLRAKKVGPNVCFIVDFADTGNNHLRGHAQERRRIIESTPGFNEGIVEDFDYEGLGLKKVV